MVREREREWMPRRSGPGAPVCSWGSGCSLNVVRLIAVRAHPGLIALSIVAQLPHLGVPDERPLHREPERSAGAAALRHLRRHVAKVAGLHWVESRSTRKKRISLRVRSFESAHLKVNDKDGNPIEIGAVVVWKVVDTAEATFEVDNYEAYVQVQSESALRNAATSYPYDSHDEAGRDLAARHAPLPSPST